MTDAADHAKTDSASDGAPRPGRLDFAQKIADRLGVDLPDQASLDWRACADFIDKNKHVLDDPPTQPQVAYAMKIAEHLNVELPPEAPASWRICKEFIEKHKAQMPPATDRPDKPASEGQIKAVKAIAARKKLTAPAGYESSSHLCSRFIDEHGDKRATPTKA